MGGCRLILYVNTGFHYSILGSITRSKYPKYIKWMEITPPWIPLFSFKTKGTAGTMFMQEFGFMDNLEQPEQAEE